MDSIRGLILKARDYDISAESAQLVESLKPLILCGVTAAGKNATSEQLETRSNFARVVSHTTRQPRQGEINGRDYWFASEPDMLDLINQQAFIEAEVLNGDIVYGSSRQALEAAASPGRQPLMTIDIQGAAKLSKVVPGLQPLFMVPPSTDVWMQRLGGRADMSDGEHDRRLHGASGELEFILSHPDFLIVVNHDIEQSSSEIIQGVPSDSGTQSERRALIKELYEFARSSNI